MPVSPFGQTSLLDEDPQKAATTKPKRNRPVPKRLSKPSPSFSTLMSSGGPPIFQKRDVPISKEVLDNLKEWTDDPERAVRGGAAEALNTVKRGEAKNVSRSARAIMQENEESYWNQMTELIDKLGAQNANLPTGPALPEAPTGMSFTQWLQARYPGMSGAIVPRGTTERAMQQYLAEQSAADQVYGRRLQRYELGQKAAGGGVVGGTRAGGGGGLLETLIKNMPTGADQTKALAALIQAQAAQTEAGKTKAPSTWPEVFATNTDPDSRRALMRFMGMQYADPKTQIAILLDSMLGNTLLPEHVADIIAKAGQEAPQTLEAMLVEQARNSGLDWLDPNNAAALSAIVALRKKYEGEGKPPIDIRTMFSLYPSFLERARTDVINDPDYKLQSPEEVQKKMHDTAIGYMGGAMNAISQLMGLGSSEKPVSSSPQGENAQQENAQQENAQQENAIDKEVETIKGIIAKQGMSTDVMDNLMDLTRDTFPVVLYRLVGDGVIDQKYADVIAEMYQNTYPIAK